MLYWVKVNGEAVNVSLNGQDELCGFYKNEYVFGRTSHEARDAAMRSVRDALKAKSGVRRDDVDRATIKAESIVPTLRFWKVLSPGGFVFYPIE
jgi:hypothetical protein